MRPPADATAWGAEAASTPLRSQGPEAGLSASANTGRGGKIIVKKRIVEILLVEDNPGDVRLMMEALKEAGVTYHLQVAQDGVHALQVLRREGTHRDAPRPELILLDLNLPRKDGREVLAEIKADRDLRCIPVVVLTTSRADQDIVRSYELHANCYISKPVGLEEYINVLQVIEEFWLKTATLPST